MIYRLVHAKNNSPSLFFKLLSRKRAVRTIPDPLSPPSQLCTVVTPTPPLTLEPTLPLKTPNTHWGETHVVQPTQKASSRSNKRTLKPTVLLNSALTQLKHDAASEHRDAMEAYLLFKLQYLQWSGGPAGPAAGGGGGWWWWWWWCVVCSLPINSP